MILDVLLSDLSLLGASNDDEDFDSTNGHGNERCAAPSANDFVPTWLGIACLP
jgi:hypothetical protein